MSVNHISGVMPKTSRAEYHLQWTNTTKQNGTHSDSWELSKWSAWQ